MDCETLEVEVDGPIGRLTLDRPDRLNALGATMLRELVEAAHFFDGEPQVRVVILRGAGRAFSAGADLKDPPSSTAGGDSEPTWMARREAGQRGFRTVEALDQMRAVTVAQVHGYAIGGALLLMMACDLRLVAEGTVFSIPEVDLGIPLAWGGIPRLVREIGPALTKELVMTCRRFTPQEAKAMGVVNRVVPEDRLADEAEALARELAAKPAVPVSITKEHVDAVSRAMAPGAGSHADGDVLLATSGDPESQATRQAYVERLVRGRSGTK